MKTKEQMIEQECLHGQIVDILRLREYIQGIGFRVNRLVSTWNDGSFWICTPTDISTESVTLRASNVIEAGRPFDVNGVYWLDLGKDFGFFNQGFVSRDGDKGLVSCDFRYRSKYSDSVLFLNESGRDEFDFRVSERIKRVINSTFVFNRYFELRALAEKIAFEKIECGTEDNFIICQTEASLSGDFAHIHNSEITLNDKGKPVFYGLYFRLPLNKIWYNKIGLFDKFRYFTISSQADVNITKYAYRSKYNSRICFVTLTARQKFDIEVGETWYQLKKAQNNSI